MPDGDRLSQDTFKQSQQSFWHKALFFLPGLLVCAIGVLALYTAFETMQLQEGLLGAHKEMMAEQVLSVRSTNQYQEMERFLDAQSRWLHNAIIGIGFAIGVLLLINIYQFQSVRGVYDQRIAHNKLLEQRSAALEAAKDGFVIADSAGQLIYINPALMTLYGISEGEYKKMLGGDWLEIYTDRNKEQIQKDILPKFITEGYWTGELAMLPRDGAAFTAEMTLMKLPGGGMVSTVRDVSERKRNEQEKEELQEQFYQAQKMEAIGRLAGGIAHDFNNILASINGYAEFLIEDLPPDGSEHEFASNIRKAGMQARELVDQILSFSRRGKIVVNTLDLNEPLQECLSMLNASLPKTIELETDIVAKPALVAANANQISQIIMNLCVNAIDAMDDDRGWLKVGLALANPEDFLPNDYFMEDLPDPKGVPRIKIEEKDFNHNRLYLNTATYDREYICLSIEDTGSGMGRRVMERIFEPFFTTKPVEKGTGLGLANVHGIVTSLQGAMIIDSVTSQGTSFYLLFPVSQQDEKGEALSDTQVLNDIDATILLVEDQEEVRDMTLKMLERLGYDAYGATMGLEALDILRENPDAIDLVITDQNMPKMTGLELIYQANIDWPDLPFILLSGYSEEKLKDLIEEHPAVKDVVRKPVAKLDLAKKIHKILSETKKKKAA